MPEPREGRPEVVAHRGASAAVAEHTLAAYQRAIDAGADTLECDVRMTADGELVCVHDRRIDRTSDGVGPVSALDLARLAERNFAPDGEEGATVLSLERLLALVRDAGRPVGLAIETKHPTRYGGLVERRLVEVLHRFGWAHPTSRGGQRSAMPVRVMSFSWLSLRRMAVLAPSIQLVQLLERVPVRLRDGRLPRHVDVMGPSIDIVRLHPRYVERVHRWGGQVHVWTVDDPADVDRCVVAGVDAIITNRPAEVLAQLEDTPATGPAHGST